MARKLPKVLEKHIWKKGMPSPNPKGRLPLTKEQRIFRKMSIDLLKEVIELSLVGTRDDLKRMIADPNTIAIQAGFAQTVLDAIQTGDPTWLEKFAERIVGKIPEVINVNNTTVNNQIAVMSYEEIKLRLRKIRDGV